MITHDDSFCKRILYKYDVSTNKGAYEPQPIKTVIITTKEEYHSMLLLNSKPSCKTSRLSKNSKEFKQISPISRALSSLLTVSTDWFLQTIMNRKPPIWPIDPQYK
ncbi:hypothetical protein Smp_130770 [Schistosoma mansoni]|uniref:hypothetical protein n=1 Tax=Schistosoma mansoni TaxID=6183 RepID=UPI0001A645D5|nr:hypothetical protein Smp_130770 [Schistosoma mansoni]|eukprot:XP_018654455.1 hypothetical protein Smp_130770 [Schistosoma mansoni]